MSIRPFPAMGLPLASLPLLLEGFVPLYFHAYRIAPTGLQNPSPKGIFGRKSA
jgi:hypothetical protein